MSRLGARPAVRATCAGAVVITEAPAAAIRPGRSVSPAVLGSVLVLVMAASASLAFVLVRGGLELAVARANPNAGRVGGRRGAGVGGSGDDGRPDPWTDGDALARADAVAVAFSVATHTHAVAEPDADAHSHGRADAPADPDVRSVRAATTVPRHPTLLDLSRAGRRQPLQHRELLRRVAGQHLRPQPVPFATASVPARTCASRRLPGSSPLRSSPRPVAPRGGVDMGRRLLPMRGSVLARSTWGVDNGPDFEPFGSESRRDRP